MSLNLNGFSTEEQNITDNNKHSDCDLKDYLVLIHVLGFLCTCQSTHQVN